MFDGPKIASHTQVVVLGIPTKSVQIPMGVCDAGRDRLATPAAGYCQRDVRASATAKPGSLSRVWADLAVARSNSRRLAPITWW
jgi:hypothetical protein